MDATSLDKKADKSNIEIYAIAEGIISKNRDTNEQIIYKFKQTNNDSKNMITCGDVDYCMSSEDDSDDSETEIDLNNANIDILNPEPYNNNNNNNKNEHNPIFDEISSIIKSVHVDGESMQCKEQRIIEMDIGYLFLDMLVKNNIIKVVTNGVYLLYNFNLKNNCFYLELMPDISYDFNCEKCGDLYNRCLSIESGINGKVILYSDITPTGYIEVLCVDMDLSGKYDDIGTIVVTDRPESSMISIIFEDKYLKLLDLKDVKDKSELMTDNVELNRENYKSNIAIINELIDKKLKIDTTDNAINKFVAEYKDKSNV